MRASGILLPVFSLPSGYGIGTFGAEAFKFVDFLKRAGQKYWQMLPIGPISYGDSPYQSFSSFAGNPYFIDLDLLCADGLLVDDDYSTIDWGTDEGYIDYAKIFEKRFGVLGIAFEKGFARDKAKVEAFRAENAAWIEDYALFMALKNHFKMKAWRLWADDIRVRRPAAMEKYRKSLKKQIDFWIYVQYLFYGQWMALKAYANGNGVKLIGDIPIYVAEDSADAWANTDILLFDKNLNPIEVSGCPPDGFTSDGQLWGNPLYRWDVLEERGFDWWINRIEGTTKLFDMVRIDHFRGFESYYAIPADEETARNGVWREGPGEKFIKAIKKSIKGADIIAEDLGYMTPAVKKLQKNSGFPGMKVLEFAFDPREKSDYLPHNYDKNCVVYTGTHDNDTIVGWRNSASRKSLAFCRQYLHFAREEGYNWGIIRAAWASVGDLAIAQMQDFLGLGSEARMNIPSTIGNNWRWRLQLNQLNDGLADTIAAITELYSR